MLVDKVKKGKDGRLAGVHNWPMNLSPFGDGAGAYADRCGEANKFLFHGTRGIVPKVSRKTEKKPCFLLETVPGMLRAF